MPGAVFLEGEEIELRNVEEEDLEFLREGVNHPEVRVHMGNRLPQNLEDEREFLEEQVSGDDTVSLLVCREGEPMGIVSLSLDSTDKVGELGIWLHPDYHGQGHGTEASALVLDHAFSQLDYHKVTAKAHEDNSASRGVWEKLGFEKEGRLRQQVFIGGEYRDIICYGLLRGEWE